MIGVFVRFYYEHDFNEAALLRIAERARAKFEAMPDLHMKAFTLNAQNREAINFYVCESEEAAKRFFTDQCLKSIGDLYGVRPSLQYVHIASLVENTSRQLASTETCSPEMISSDKDSG
jgi:hypothetical protein